MEKEISAVLCPYDRNHIIHKSRIQRHLLRCSRNFPPNYLEKCPFNATHLIKETELAFHIEQCPDRRYIDSERCRLEVKKHGSLRPCPPSKAESCIDIYSDIWEDSDLQSFERTDASVVSDCSTILPRNNNIGRHPYGCSEAIMLEFPDDSHDEDLESVTSSMAVGRGKFMSQKKRINESSRVGRGRGLFIPEMLKAGASATTDVEDTESVTSSIGRGGINYPQYLRNPGKVNRDPFLEYINKLPGNRRTQM